MLPNDTFSRAIIVGLSYYCCCCCCSQVRRVSIVNRSKRTAAFALEDVVKDTTTGKGALESGFVSIAPRAGTLRPKESMIIEVCSKTYSRDRLQSAMR